MPNKTACRRCHERWAQEQGLCRRCARETGQFRAMDPATKHMVTRQADQFILPDVADLIPRVARVVTIDGQEYEVNWDGA